MNRRKIILGLAAVSLLVGLLVQALLPNYASANQITNRSLTLQAGATDGGSKPSGNVNHLFSYTLPNTVAANPTGNIGSVLFLYCQTPADAPGGSCVTPTGLNAAGATLGSMTGATFTTVTAAAGNVCVSRSPATPISPGTAVTTQLLGVVNPSTDNYTFYVRISSYSGTTCTGSPIDTGSVAASTAEPIVLNGVMPESLVFCTGATVNTTSGVPDCTTATSGNISFDRLFSPIDTAAASSQMAASTNAGSGYIITVNGVTLTSGSNTITAMSTTPTGDAPVHGISQFGLNLKANTVATTTPAPGAEVAPASNGTNYRGESKSGYASVDHFRFVTGNTVADSCGLTGTNCGGTDAQIYSVSYVVDVPGSQPAGTYTTTLTYICTPTF